MLHFIISMCYIRAIILDKICSLSTTENPGYTSENRYSGTEYNSDV